MMRSIRLDRAGGARGRARARARRVRFEQLELAARGRKSPRAFRPRRREPLTGGKRGGTLTVLNHEDFEHIDPGQAYFSIDYEAVYATQRPLYSYKPNTFPRRAPDMAAGPPEISSDAQDDHRPHPPRRPLQPAGQPRSDLGGRRLRDRARRQPERGQPLLRIAYFASMEGCEQGQRRADPGHHHAEQVHDRISPDRTEGADRRGRARAAAERAGAGGIREEVRRQETERIRQLPGRHRPVHVQGQQRRQGARASAISPASRPRSCATPTGTRAPTSGPPTWTRSTSTSAATRT